MSTATRIEWTDVTWNPTTGCDQVSAGCDNCYALTMAGRLKAMGQPKYQRDGDPRTSGPGFGITEHPDVLDQMLCRKKPAMVFVNSMSDLFHAGVRAKFIARVFAVMALTPHVTYQVLTKRHGRMRSILSSPVFEVAMKDAAWLMARGEDPDISTRGVAAAEMAYAGYPTVDGIQFARIIPWPLPNVILGVSAEDQKHADIRIPALRETPAAVRFVSAEPLLGPLPSLDLTGIHWVISGGESGPSARPAPAAWFREIRDQCATAGVAYLHKQNGGWTSVAGHDDPWYDREPDAWVNLSDGRAINDDTDPALNTGSWSGMWRVGKKAAGRKLDGIIHDAHPPVPERTAS